MMDEVSPYCSCEGPWSSHISVMMCPSSCSSGPCRFHLNCLNRPSSRVGSGLTVSFMSQYNNRFCLGHPLHLWLSGAPHRGIQSSWVPIPSFTLLRRATEQSNSFLRPFFSWVSFCRGFHRISPYWSPTDPRLPSIPQLPTHTPWKSCTTLSKHHRIETLTLQIVTNSKSRSPLAPFGPTPFSISSS